MAKKPFKLVWSQIIPEIEDAASPWEVLVVPSPPQMPSSPASVVESLPSSNEQLLTDYELENKILRLTKHIESNISTSLPDKGRKLRENLRVCEEERDRRERTKIQKLTEICKTTTEPKAKESNFAPSNSINAAATSECESVSLYSQFNQKLEEMADSLSRTQNSSANSCQIDERMNLHHSSHQVVRISSTDAHSHKNNIVEKKRSLNGNCKSVKTSCFYGSSNGKRSSKRLRIFEGRNAIFLRPKKVQDVVLLDEIDAHLKDPIKQASDYRNEAKMYYPSRDHPESIELSYSDLKCLEPEQYISSHIMNFYIRYLQRSLSFTNKTKEEYYFFNTYFFGKLQEALSTKGDDSLRFLKLRRWWKGVNIFEKAYIFLPIHKDLHWSLIIISFSPKKDESRAIILHLDSLSLHNSSIILEVVQCYLTEEWEYVKKNESSPDICTAGKILTCTPLKIVKKKIKVPQQKNEYDCGLFVLYFMELFIKEAPQRLKKKDIIAMFGSKWFRPEDASGLRQRMRDLLLEEFESLRLEYGKQEQDEEEDS